MYVTGVDGAWVRSLAPVSVLDPLAGSVSPYVKRLLE